jgi:uncharacterized protein
VTKVIDMECYLPGPRFWPPGSELPGPQGPDRLPGPPGYGFENYRTIFGAGTERWRDGAEQDPDSLRRRADELVEMMDQAGIEKAVLPTLLNGEVAEVIRRHPDRLYGFIHLSPFDGMRAVRELERLVTEEHVAGMSVAALYDRVSASDRRYYPLYAKCVELNLPVRIYTAMTYANDRPYDLAHPRHVDTVAVDFPELTLIVGLGGWPWVADTVAILRRHPNLFCDTAAHRAKYFAQPGSGWEQFMQFGNTLLQDKIMVGLSWPLVGLSLRGAIDEYLQLPLKERVKEKWLYENAARVMGFQ